MAPGHPAPHEARRRAPDRRRAPEGAADTSESNQTLWLLAAAPIVWVLHFLACYGMVSLWCARLAGPVGPLGVTRPIVAGLTVAALLAIGFVGLVGMRRHRLGIASLPHDFDTPEDRHRFLGFATVLLAALSAVAVVYVAMAAVFLETCR